LAVDPKKVTTILD
jgi:hypothetical protein